MKQLILIFSLLFGPTAFAADIAGANQLITQALRLHSNETQLKGFAGLVRPPVIGLAGELECWLRVNLDADRAYIQLWSKESSGYSSESNLEYVHGEDEPDIFGTPRILENNEEALRLETDVTRPRRVFYPDGDEQTQSLTIRKDPKSQLLSVEIRVKLRDGKPNETSRLACRFPIVP